MNEHLPIDVLIDLLAELLPEDQSTAAYQHLQACNSCRMERLRIEHLFIQMQTLGQTYPPHSNAWMHAIYRTARLATRTQRTVTDTIFDSYTTPSPIGLRSGKHIERQQLFTCEPYLIDLRLAPAYSPFPITGQIIGSLTGGTAVLGLPDHPIEQPINDQGEFRFAAVEPGQHSLFLVIAHEVLLFPQIVVKA
ncbi:MAG: hypothetical protein AB4911_17515 [Oscillochloridaceae bacterium umkhey_bin13]